MFHNVLLARALADCKAVVASGVPARSLGRPARSIGSVTDIYRQDRRAAAVEPIENFRYRAIVETTKMGGNQSDKTRIMGSFSAEREE